MTGTKNSVLLPSSRNISNTVHTVHVAGNQNKADNDQGISLALFYSMQFIDYDIIKTPEAAASVCPSWLKRTTTAMTPAIALTPDFIVFDCDDNSGFQNQINDITAYMDASMVYGSSEEEVNQLRSYVAGYLKTSTAKLMPEATGDALEDQACDVESPALCFQAGDTRADVVPGLTTFHTVFMREHNRIAAEIGTINSHWSDERIFQESRKIVTAEIQHIAYTYMLPKLLDSTFLSQYGITDTYSYNSSQDASIIQALSLAYRYHTLMPSELHMEELDGGDFKSTTIQQNLSWMDPGYLFHTNYKGVDHIAHGLANKSCPHFDSMMNDASRNYLFADSDGKGFDLAALNIERGREWGTPAYNNYRVLCGFGDATTWDDLTGTHSADAIAKTSNIIRFLLLFRSPRDIDLWTGVVTETPVGSFLSGSTQSCIVAQQFANIRFGDRFWYETDGNEGFTADQLDAIKNVTLSRILCDNLDIAIMSSDVFNSPSTWKTCDDFDGMDLDNWAETV